MEWTDGDYDSHCIDGVSLYDAYSLAMEVEDRGEEVAEEELARVERRVRS